MPDVSPPELLDYIEQLLVAAGAPDHDAAIVAAHLVESNLKGHDSHGVNRVTQYVTAIRDRSMSPGAPIVTERESDTTALLDGGWGFGQVAARRAMQLAIAKARSSGVGVVTGRRVAHIGRLGAYAEQAAEVGMIGIVMSSGSPLVAAHGGAAARLSTNPIAIGIPTADRDAPFVLDMATSAVAAGTVRLAQGLGARIPQDWLLDPSGAPTTDPAALEAGGALRPLGGLEGYKGFGLALAVEALAGLLAGSDPPGPSTPPDQGLFVLALDPERFIGRSALEASMSALIAWVRQPPYQPGFEDVLAPGDRSRRYASERALAIPIDEATWAQLSAVAASLGVAPPALEPRGSRRRRSPDDEDGPPDD